MSESTQHKLSRIRPPRVQITYDVETGGAIEKKELPLVVGILADLAGKRPEDKPLPFLKDRKFVEIDRDNFNEVFASIDPRVAFQVDDKLSDNGAKLSVELSFSKLKGILEEIKRPEDVAKYSGASFFHPGSIVLQVDALRKLLEARTRLNDLLAKLDGNDDLDALLQDVATHTEKQQQLQAEIDKAKEGG